MTTEKWAFGQKGEAAAARYYLDRGCKLLAHGYRTRMGELDLVLREEETVVIAEVKARADTRRGPAAQAVDRAKQRRLILAAERFLQQNGLTEHPVRFDVVEITPAAGGGLLVHCIKNAFEA